MTWLARFFDWLTRRPRRAVYYRRQSVHRDVRRRVAAYQREREAAVRRGTEWWR